MKDLKKQLIKAKNFWLMKSEPDVFSIDDLKKCKDMTEPWDGVRNYQARNFMKSMEIGDLVLFYHSNAKPPGIVGVAKVAKLAYPDHTSWDKKSKYFDEKSTKDSPRWFMVDVKFVAKLDNIISLDDLKNNARLKGMKVAQKGSRLSVQPVEKSDFVEVLKMSQK